MADAEHQQGSTLAQKLDRLFRTIHAREEAERSVEEVVEGIRARGGPTISAAYLYQLRNGQRDNPTKHHLEALAEYFGIPPSYFFDEAAAERIDAELDLLAALRDSSVRHIALRSFGLSTESLRAITEMVERVRQLEGLREPEEPRPRRGRPPGDGKGVS